MPYKEIEGTGCPCRIPGCDGSIVLEWGWKHPENPRIGGGPQGHRILVSRHCELCGVQYRFEQARYKSI